MKKLYLNCLALIAFLCVSFGAKAVSWPANYQGVMLQGFYWDSYKLTTYGTTKWADLTSKVDELSKYFSLIWVPNSAQANGENYGGNGYMPVYWFTNHRCAYGTEAQLKAMIDAFKAKGTGIIEDCVINHRVGASNWYDFPKETWNGKTYQLTNGAICSTDEMWQEGGHGCPYTKGNPDEGEDFNGARDLDHTNTTVQDHCKDYVKFLTTDRGYAGLRYDMVKGYSGYYTGMYNANANVKFSVGEFFDGNYDKVARWIDQTAEYGNGAGKSAAFDFPQKYALNEAFSSNDMRKLAWTNPSNQPQPAGMIHYGYTQFAVTFVDNHDTFRDGSKFPSDPNIVAANAFILFSPGTPCVFWPHYQSNKAAIQAMIDARNSLGIHNLSPVKVLKLENNCYAAEITGTKGKAVVKIGSDTSFSPGNGYKIVSSGTNYCVWSTNGGGIDTPTPDPNPGTSFTVYFKNNANWTTPYIHYWGGSSQSEWPGVAMTKHKDNIWKFTVPAGTTGILFNAGDGDPTKTSDFVAQANHVYTTAGDQGPYSDDVDIPDPQPFNVYFKNDKNWTTPHIHHWGGAQTTWPGVAMTKHKDDVWKYTVPAGTTGILFNAGDGDATKTEDFVAQANHLYTTSGDLGVYSDAGNDDPKPNPNPNPGTYPDVLYMIGNLNGTTWDVTNSPAAKGTNGVYTWTDVTIDDADKGYGWFSYITSLGATWDEVNSTDRYGSTANDELVSSNSTSEVVLYQAGVNASAAASWKIEAGKYTFIVDLTKMLLTVSTTTGVDFTVPIDYPVEYYNLQGIRVVNPTHGIYIKRQGNKTEKVILN